MQEDLDTVEQKQGATGGGKSWNKETEKDFSKRKENVKELKNGKHN